LAWLTNSDGLGYSNDLAGFVDWQWGWPNKKLNNKLDENNWRSDTVSVQGCLTCSPRFVKLCLVRQAGNRLFCFLFLLFCLSPIVIADELHLRDGRVIQVEEFG
jgi:hypothetical protein